MIHKILIYIMITTTYAFYLPNLHKKSKSLIFMNSGKGFGGGEATRDPPPTNYDPNDPKAKQTAIFKADTYEEYMAKRNGKLREVPREVIREVTYEEYTAKLQALKPKSFFSPAPVPVPVQVPVPVPVPVSVSTPPVPPPAPSPYLQEKGTYKEYIERINSYRPSVTSSSSIDIKKAETYEEYIARMTTPQSSSRTDVKKAETYEEYMARMTTHQPLKKMNKPQTYDEYMASRK
jgi:hypothetical protein